MNLLANLIDQSTFVCISFISIVVYIHEYPFRIIQSCSFQTRHGLHIQKVATTSLVAFQPNWIPITSSKSYILKLPSLCIVQRFYVHDFIYGDASMEAKFSYCAFVVTYYKTHMTLKIGCFTCTMIFLKPRKMFKVCCLR